MTPPTTESIRTALSFISPNLPRDEWARIAMALKSELGGSGFDLFDAWSQGGDQYKAHATRDTWRSVSEGGGVTIGTLFHLAKQHGFKPESVQTPAQTMSPAELKAQVQAQAKARRERDQAAQRERSTAQQKAATEAARLWEQTSDTGHSAYLERKGVQGHGVRFGADGWLIVPMRDTAGQLLNVQRIAPAKPTEGPDKLFLKGGRKVGLMHWCGEPSGAALLLLAEGYATAASLHAATGHPAAVAFDAGNLAHVVRALRGTYPQARIIVCGDDDRDTEAKTGKNPGRDKATEAAKLAQSIAVFPEGLPDGGSDFNDMAAHAGLDAVRLIVQRAIEAKPMEASNTTASAGNESRPQGFSVDESGLWHRKDEDSRPRRICDPLHVLAKACNLLGSGFAYVLQFDTPHSKARRWLMPLTMLSGDGSAYRDRLFDQGFMAPIDAERRRLLTEYLQSSNPPELIRTVSRVGWHGRAYVLPSETMGTPNEPVMFHSEAGIEANFSQRGTLEQWRNNLAGLCTGNSRLAFAVACAFAGPLLAWAPGTTGGGFHYVGDSSIGKTTGLLIAASVWGKGTEKDPDSYMQKWRATSNGLEFQGEQHNDCTLILDELGQMEPAEAAQSAYMLSDGRGKLRGKAAGGLRQTPTWRLLFLSTGELTLAQHVESIGKKIKAGQEVRMITIPAEITRGTSLETLHDFATGHELSGHVMQHGAKHYGTAGRAWLEWLTKHTDTLTRELRERMEAFEAQAVPEAASGQVKRAGKRFALVAAAGDMATAAGLTGWPDGEASRAARTCFDAWIEQRAGGIGASEDAAMLAHLRQWFGMYEMNFKRWGVTDDSHAPNTPLMCGWRKPVMGDERNSVGDLVNVQVGTVWYVLAEQFRTVVCKGFDYKRCLDVLRTGGHLMLEPGDEARKTVRTHRARPPGQSKDGATVYRVKSSLLDGGD